MVDQPPNVSKYKLSHWNTYKVDTYVLVYGNPRIMFTEPGQLYASFFDPVPVHYALCTRWPTCHFTLVGSFEGVARGYSSAFLSGQGTVEEGRGQELKGYWLSKLYSRLGRCQIIWSITFWTLGPPHREGCVNSHTNSLLRWSSTRTKHNHVEAVYSNSLFPQWIDSFKITVIGYNVEKNKHL